jgi:PAS domain-containing protein
MNRAVEKMLGYSREEVPTLCAWFKALYRDGAAEAKRLYDEDQKHVSGTQTAPYLYFELVLFSVDSGKVLV